MGRLHAAVVQTFIDNAEILAALRMSLWVAALTAVVTTVLAIPASIALVRRRFFAKGLVSGVMLAPLVIPLVVLGTALLILFNTIGMPFSGLTIAIGHIVIALPFAILTLVPRLERIPASLEEASRDLGAGWFTTFRQITWPLMLPAIFSAFLLSFVISFDEVVVASFVAGDQVTFPVYLYSQLRLPRRLPQVIAVAVVILCISAIVVIASEVLRKVTDRRLEAEHDRDRRGGGVGGVSETGVAISIQGVRKSFGDVHAVDGISLDIAEGEFITLLGPSGCGKTTTMRMVAGFEEPDEGRILLRGDDVVGVPPNKREVNMCFQHYALFPHMNVERNIEYGLQLKKVPKDDRRSIVAEMLEIVGLAGLQQRKPGQLSGGQQQRVALARALVNQPAALLLDEPLGALDVKLRKQMQLELKRIQHELKTTFVYVTHDQDEALSMSDRIAVMNQGVIEQLGEPREVYEQPATPFVADFVGVLNAMDVRVDEVSGEDLVMKVNERDRSRRAGRSDRHRRGRRLVAAGRGAPRAGRAGRPATRRRTAARGCRAPSPGRLPRHADPVPRRHVDRQAPDRAPPERRPLFDGGQGDEVVLTWAREDAAVLSG